jgi:hypothetical protein
MRKRAAAATLSLDDWQADEEMPIWPAKSRQLTRSGRLPPYASRKASFSLA